MLSFASAPIFTANWDHHRPAVSSPLSSSPLRASSPLGNQGETQFSIREIQSSPIRAPKFKYSSRPAHPNPVMRRREDAQEQRRTKFLCDVRRKAEDKAWERRDIEGQFLRTNWIADIDRLSHDAPEISEADIEDASSFEPDSLQPEDVDDAMVDEYADDAELEAMFALYHQQQPQSHSPAQRPVSPTTSDDEYDEIFEELLAAKDVDQAMQDLQSHSADQMDME